MQTLTITQQQYQTQEITAAFKKAQCSNIEKFLVFNMRKMQLIFLLCRIVKKPSLVFKGWKQLATLHTKTWGKQVTKLFKVNGYYYNNLYTPGWPSAAYNSFLKDELQRHLQPLQHQGNLSFIFMAITRKCPMRCEHCFEWDNLNKKETFTLAEWKQVVDIYQQQGVMQIHFSGGEPMVRFHDLLEIIRHARIKSECHVVTSGFNLTQNNARLLKQAGCKGVVVSIDHYIPSMHNGFRHHANIFEQAVAGVKASLQAGMLTTISVCVTKDFIDGHHLLPYLEFAKQLGVHFVQLLEPKAIGHYTDKDVTLKESHIQKLEAFFMLVNHNKTYATYPTVMYHGFHQRRIGCYAGSRTVYIDSAGDVHACPFCHTSAYNVAALLKTPGSMAPHKENYCPRYTKIA